MDEDQMFDDHEAIRGKSERTFRCVCLCEGFVEYQAIAHKGATPAKQMAEALKIWCNVYQTGGMMIDWGLIYFQPV